MSTVDKVIFKNIETLLDELAMKESISDITNNAYVQQIVSCHLGTVAKIREGQAIDSDSSARDHIQQYFQNNYITDEDEAEVDSDVAFSDSDDSDVSF
jgi:hypothetical protein